MTKFWPLYVMGRWGQDFLQFPERHQAGRERQEAEQGFQNERDHDKAMRRFAVVFGGADQSRRQRAEGVRERGPLRDGRHGHQIRQRDAHGRANEESDENPLIADDFVAEQRADHGQQHADLAHIHATAGGFRRAHPLDGQDEADGGENIKRRENSLDHFLTGSLFLNICSMRSVIR